MTICPNNSTECLLRVLVEDGDAFNWNIPSFAVTAATGFLALIIACIAVFQGLLAAGPGRFKASRSAIGPWSAKTRSRFDWTDFGLRTIAEVPFLNLDGDLDRKIDSIFFDNVLNLDPNRDLMYPKVRYYGNTTENNTSGINTNQATASWLTLLYSAGFVSLKSWEARPILTDYLPADVQAAPASASVLCLIALALLSDDDFTIDHYPGSRFVRVQGAVSQLRMRNHPILGPVAAYEVYGVPSYRHTTISAQTCLSFALGDLTCGGVSLDLRTTWQYISRWYRFSRQGIWKNFYARYPQHISEGARGLSGFLLDDGSYRPQSLVASLLLLCDLPNRRQAKAFPYELARIPAACAITVLTQKPLLWSAEALVDKTGTELMKVYAENMDRDPGPSHKSWLTNPTKQDPFIERFINLEVLQYCLSWAAHLAQDTRVSFRHVCDRHSRVRALLHNQLALVDQLLGYYPCQTTTSKSLYLLKEIETVSQGLQCQPVMVQPGEASQVASMLILRMVIFAALLDLCADTGFLLNGEFKGSIVKML
jgi:hypothetical protein